jgi:hypothetical protein
MRVFVNQISLVKARERERKKEIEIEKKKSGGHLS